MVSSFSKAEEGWRISKILLIASSLFTIVGFIAICSSVMADLRRDEEDLATQSSRNLASTIESDISRNIEIYDLSLRAVVTNLTLPGIERMDRALRHLVLFDYSTRARHFAPLQVFDAKGNLTIDAASLDPTDANIADEEFFRIHQTRSDTDLFISKPTVHHGALSIVFSRRRVDRDGGFAGVVLGAIRIAYFEDLFARLTFAEGDTVSVVRRDGIVITRRPFEPEFLGRDVSRAEGVSRILAEPAGSMPGVSALDGIPRLFTWEGRNPYLVVVVGRPFAHIFAIWNSQAMWIGLAIFILVAFVIFNAVLLGREIARRGRAEMQLENLATTDGLTGINNRRKFDRDLDLEWQRALRTREPLTLMMIDADHFKSYNDRFGHQAGDAALTAVAGCIAASGARPGDCAARYGGEEFALLLPGVRRSDAIRIADAIHRRTAASFADRPVTVSIGIATVIPSAKTSKVSLIGQADRALYEAKSAGRNCSRLAPEIEAQAA
jgi:diguanylate cyclase (GGDEF)-like protein